MPNPPAPMPVPPKPKPVVVQKPQPFHLGGGWIKTKELMKIIILGVVVVCVVFVIPFGALYTLGTINPDEFVRSFSKKYTQRIDGPRYVPPTAFDDCTVLGLEVNGELLTYLSPYFTAPDGTVLEDFSTSDYLVSAIRAAEKDETVQAILLAIDSPGGYPVAGEEIAVALRAATKPTVAVIRQLGASAAYLAAVGADRIYASKLSEVGSIGLTYSYVDHAKQNEQDGLTYNQVSTGEYKDTGSPEKLLTEPERALLERNLKVGLDRMVELIAEYRSMPEASVKELANGETWLGQVALEKKLIDAIGGLPEALDYLKGKLELEDQPAVCW